jgi:hypothetical protein
VLVADVVSATGPAIFNTRDGRQPPQPSDLPENIWSGTTTLLTPVTLDVEEALKGDAAPGTLQVYLEGGEVGCIVQSFDSTPEVATGARYVVTLVPGIDEDGTQRPERPRIIAAWSIGPDGMVDTEADGNVPLVELRDIVGP